MKNTSKEKCCVIMSSYNGEKTIVRQIESILNQCDVDILLCIRDDGSSDSTLSILEKNYKSNPKVYVESGLNIGWEKSFLLALEHAPKADYYAFSDQDDIWNNNKVIEGVKALNNITEDKPLLYHCNKISVNENLTPFTHQVRRIPKPLNHQNAMVQEFAQGCSIIINEKARELITSYFPKAKIAHDFWSGLICYLFGEVIYDDNKYFYHISYGGNASGEGHVIRSWYNRLKKLLFEQEAYYSPCQDLLEGFCGLLSEEDKKFCFRVVNYRSNLCDKLYLLFSPKFIRNSILGTISLKIAVLFNKL